MNAGALLRAVLAALLLGAVACGGGQPPAAETSTPSPVATPTATATATATPTVPPPPADSLAGDLAALLEMRDALAGSGALNWDARLPGEDWDGVTITGAPPRVTALDLADRRLSGTIPPMLRRLAALTTLDLSGNRLATIPPELGGLAALTTLDLSGNRLATIPPELGGLAALTTLDLSGNRLATIPPELGRLAALTTLDLSGNRLATIPPELGRLAALTTLDLSGNPLAEHFSLELERPPALTLLPAFPGLPELEEPIGLVEVPEHDLFLIVLQEGRVLAVPRNGPWSAPHTVHDQRQRTSTIHHESGLLAIALDPDFARNGYVYAYYSVHPPPDVFISRLSRLVRFATTGKGSAFAFDAASELLILEVEQIDGAHNGGALLFGPDGMLYLSLGDGGSGGTGGDPYGHGQNPRTLLGTVVRIDVRGATEEAPYAIPPDNPFRDREDARPEVWAYGLRNPWRMSLDRATGLLWAGDAGEVWREEVNIVRAGANYGWNVTEGSLCISPPEADCDRSGITPPLHDYDRSYGCAIIGGYVYRGVAIPTLRGWYLFSDYCNSGIRAIPTFGEVANSVLLWDGGPDQVVSFAEDSDGELYVISQQGARIYRVIADPAANGTPVASR